MFINDFDHVGKLGGTPGYASPENFSEPLLSKSDIWSFGKTLLYLYTSQDVFKCLTLIPLIPGANQFASETEMQNMLDCLLSFLQSNPIFGLVENLLSLGRFL